MTDTTELPPELAEIRQRYGRPLTDDEISNELGRLYRDRIASRDWRQVPKGYYAIPVYDELGYIARDCEGELEVIGYQMYFRKVARQCKNGRVIGGNRFVQGVTWIEPGADPDTVHRHIEDDREAAGNHQEYIRHVVDKILIDIEKDDTYRATYGKITGKCGWCGKTLTDPKSKLIGIGPDCRGYR